jgi:tetratricopeptide (TPR) repeat protein
MRRVAFPAAGLLALGVVLGLSSAGTGCSSDPPEDSGDAADRAAALYRQGLALRAEGRPDEAILAFREGVRIGPYDEWSRYVLGHLQVEHAPLDEVIDYYRVTLHADPKPQTSHYFWARALARAGRTEEAIAHFRMALEVDPAHEVSHNGWGEALDAIGRTDEAEQHYRASLRIHPEYPEAHRNLARLLEARGARDEAEAHRQRAEEGDLRSPRRFLYWGRALLEAERPEEARPLLEKASRVGASRDEARALLEQLPAPATP